MLRIILLLVLLGISSTNAILLDYTFSVKNILIISLICAAIGGIIGGISAKAGTNIWTGHVKETRPYLQNTSEIIDYPQEYQQILDHYALEGMGWFSKLVSEEEWGDIKIGEEYLKKYWLSDNEYHQIWKPIQNQIFINDTIGIPGATFLEKYELLFFVGGGLFILEDFIKLQKCMLALEEEFFVVIENPLIEDVKEPRFQLKFPVDITWEELTSGNFVSSTFIESMYKEFFVFGEKGLWGRYSASDYVPPIDVFGFKTEAEYVFKAFFNQTEEERTAILKEIAEGFR